MIRTSIFVHVTAMNSLVNILVGNQSPSPELGDYDLPSVFLYQIKTSVADFVSLAAYQKYLLRSEFGDSSLKDVYRHQKELLHVFSQKGTYFVVFQPFDGHGPRVFEVLGSLRLSFQRYFSILEGSVDADTN